MTQALYIWRRMMTDGANLCDSQNHQNMKRALDMRPSPWQCFTHPLWWRGRASILPWLTPTRAPGFNGHTTTPTAMLIAILHVGCHWPRHWSAVRWSTSLPTALSSRPKSQTFSTMPLCHWPTSPSLSGSLENKTVFSKPIKQPARVNFQCWLPD